MDIRDAMTLSAVGKFKYFLILLGDYSSFARADQTHSPTQV